MCQVHRFKNRFPALKSYKCLKLKIEYLKIELPPECTD